MKIERVQRPIHPRLLLQQELERRCQANPRYSLRAFAKALDMSPAGLSYAIAGKRPVSRKTVRKMIGLLPLSPEESHALNEWATAPSRRKERKPETFFAAPAEANAYLLSLDSFAFISDWYHYAILSLLEIPGARFEAKWISRHLRITEIEAKGAMERLQRLGIVQKVDGRWRQTSGAIRIASDVPTAATKKFQKQILLKAVESIENDPDDCKDMSSMTLAMDPALVPYAKERIREFRRQLAEELEKKSPPKRVYKLTVQVFPVSQPSDNQEISK
jgi:uncharacterized protein (TIGR02147 family)